MGLFLGAILIFSLICGCLGDFGTVYIYGESSIGRTDDDFVCATLDWWPIEKCDYGTCSWGHASLLNLDLSNDLFLNAIQAFSPLKIRIGGTLQDRVIYETEEDTKTCFPFVQNSSELFGFNQGCLPLSRWDELNSFFTKSGAVIVFGLNALNGRRFNPDGTATGNWDSTNAESLIRYTLKKGYTIHGWELGNELSGNGVGLRVTAKQYDFDTIRLKQIVKEIYEDVDEDSQPLIIGPAGFFDANWFQDYINNANNSLDVVTHHIYCLGSGKDPDLVKKILNPSYLDLEADTFNQLQNILKNSGTFTNAWVGEAGGAYNSGQNHVTNAFVFSFWYLDQLGMSSSYDTKTYCRQSLIGGNYGLLNTTNFVPNPDYYSALLWHRLMGRNVLKTTFTGTKKIRAYAHCAKKSQGITLLLMNLDGNSTVEVDVFFDDSEMDRHTEHKTRQSPLSSSLSTSWIDYDASPREEYHLTPKDGDIQSQRVLLNGEELVVDPSLGQIPPLEPWLVNPYEPIYVAPFSIVFAHMPNVLTLACS